MNVQSLHSVWQDWEVLFLPAGICDLTHLWHLQKAAEIPNTAAWSRSVCPHNHVLAGTFGTGRQAAELGSVGFLFLCLFLVILSSYSCDSGTKMNVKNVGAEILLAAFVQLIAPI